MSDWRLWVGGGGGGETLAPASLWCSDDQSVRVLLSQARISAPRRKQPSKEEQLTEGRRAGR
jgi:hypothetical protein